MKNLGLPSETISKIINSPTILHSGDLSSLGITASEAQQILIGYTRGFRTVFILNASLAATATVAAIVLIKHKTLTRDEDNELKQQAKEWLSKSKAQDSEAGVVDEKAEDLSSSDKTHRDSEIQVGEELPKTA